MANLVSSLLTPYTHMVSSPVNYAEASHRHCFAFVFVVQPLNCVWLFETLWTAVHQASLSITIFQSLLKFMSIELVILTNHLILCHPFLLLPFPNIRVFSNESSLRIRWSKYWSFSFSISPSKEYSGLISFRVDWFDHLAVQGTLKSLLQHHSLKASVFWHWAFLMAQLSRPYMTTGKTIALAILIQKLPNLYFRFACRFKFISTALEEWSVEAYHWA